MTTAAERTVALAEALVGVPYAYPPASADAFDCGALVRACSDTSGGAAGAVTAWPGGPTFVAGGGGGGTPVVAGTVTPPNWEPAFVTVPNVEILEVGDHWETSTGVFDFTPEDLRACIASQEDPAIRTPVLKLGHTDPRFDGQPAVGRLENLRLSANGMTLLADLVGVPLWLAKIMSSAFPRRSIEGNFEVTTRTGNTWPMILTGLALLGDAYPAVDTLEDIKALWGSETPVLYPVEDVEEIAAAADGRFRARKVEDMPKWLQRQGGVAAARSNVAASVSVYDLPREYYDQLDAGQTWWWVREILVNPLQLVVDDDEGGLWLVDVNVGAGDAITFSDPTQVKVEYVAAGAAHRKPGQMITATFKAPQDTGRPVRAAGDTQTPDPETPGGTDTGSEGSGMTPEQLRAAIGLPADATDEQVQARLTALQAAEAGNGNGGDGDGGTVTTPGTPGTTETPGTGTEGNPASQPETPATSPGGQPATTPAPETTPGTGEAAPPATTTPPPGTVLVDEAQWAEVQQEIAASRATREQQAASDRDAFLENAIKAGKFPRARREHYLTAWAADSVGTRQLIEQLPAGLVPVTEIGAAAATGSDSPEAGPAYPDSWKPTVAAARQGVGSRIKVVGD